MAFVAENSKNLNLFEILSWYSQTIVKNSLRTGEFRQLRIGQHIVDTNAGKELP
jgi:hypothetical protein